MPQLTVSFFVLAGYFVPGSVFIAMVLAAFANQMPGTCPSNIVVWVSSLKTQTAVVLAVPGLSLTLFVGACLADAFALIQLTISRREKKVAPMTDDTVSAALADPLAREQYVFNKAGEKDLYGLIGRIRIVGGGGLASMLGGGVLWLGGCDRLVCQSAILLGSVGLIVGYFRMNAYFHILDVDSRLLRSFDREEHARRASLSAGSGGRHG
jgi:hypothetical protein